MKKVKSVAARTSKAELRTLTEKLDAEAVQKLNNILAMIDENHTAKITRRLYDYMQNNMDTKENLNEMHLAAQDEDYAIKFEIAIDAVCSSHACKLQTFKEAIEAKHAKNELKLLKKILIKKYQELLTESVPQNIDENNSKN